MELPETKDRRYKVISEIYSPRKSSKNVPTEKIDVGIVSQTSINHLYNLVKLVKIWNGPISVGNSFIIFLNFFNDFFFTIL